MHRIVVLLPDPFGPRNPVTLPGTTSKLRSSTATILPNRLVRPRTSITGPYQTTHNPEKQPMPVQPPPNCLLQMNLGSRGERDIF